MICTLEARKAYAYTGGKALDATLPGVIFIHGAMHDHSVWIQQSRYLAHHGFAVLAVDLPGHGRSEGPALGVEAAGAWVAELARACGLQRITLVGHSMGSLIALEAASLLTKDVSLPYPRVHHLVMVGSAYPMKVSAALLQMSLEEPLRAIDLVNSLSNSTHAAKPSHPGPGFSNHGGNRALMRRMQQNCTAAGHGNLFHQDFLACDAYAGLDAAAARLQCPSTLVLGRRDQMTPPQAVAPLVAALKPARVDLDCGHMLMAEAPDGVLDAVLAACNTACNTAL